MTFKDSMVTSGHLAEIFCIFTSGMKSNKLLQFGLAQRPVVTVNLATNSSYTKNGEENTCTGAGIFYAEGDPLNWSVKMLRDITQLNQAGELLALKEAVEHGPEDMNLDIELDSKYAISLVTQDLKKIEDSGYYSKHLSCEIGDS